MMMIMMMTMMTMTMTMIVIMTDIYSHITKTKDKTEQNRHVQARLGSFVFVFRDLCLYTEKNSPILLFTIGPTDSSACFAVVAFSLTVLKTFLE